MCACTMGLIQCLMRKLMKFRILLVNVFLFIGCSMTVLQLVMEPENGVAEKPLNYQSIDYDLQSAGYDRDQSCQFPVLNPFDPSILAYVKHPFPIFCQRVQPEFTYVRDHYLKMDASLANRHRLKNVYYRSIVRKNETHIKFGNWTFWNFTQLPTVYLKESLEIYGQYIFDQRDTKIPPKRYKNLHASVHVENRKLRNPTNRSENPLNVLIFGIDSLSRSNFIRNLPKTYAVLTDLMGSIVFRGYTKIDDNTFPNILAVLTGRKVTIHGSELSGHFQHDHVDHYPFVWKNFSHHGYVTGLAEEQPGVLSYKAKGFRKSPVDWYLRPFGIALDKTTLRKHSSPYCVGNRPESKIVLESIDRFLRMCRDGGLPYFLFSFLWKLSHDKTYDVETIDHIIADFFRTLYQDGYFNNTIIFVMSDHGNRFDLIRRTLVGRYEERMPYLSVYVPPRFRTDHPRVIQNLNRNIWRLTCQYDVYETMLDILHGHYGDDQRSTYKNRGRSLFASILESRTCDDAQISPHFCVCQKEEHLDIKSPLVNVAAEYALDRINTHYLGSKELKTLCSRRNLKRVISAQKYKASDHVRYAIRWHYNKLLSEKNVTSIVSNVRVTFTSSPDDAIFEALVQYYEDDHSDGTTLNATNVDISRINAYGQNGDCVSKLNRNLEKFCSCKRGLWFL